MESGSEVVDVGEVLDQIFGLFLKMVVFDEEEDDFSEVERFLDVPFSQDGGGHHSPFL